MIKNLGFILAIMLIIWGIYQVIIFCFFLSVREDGSPSDTMSAYNNIYIDFKYNLDNMAENINQETKGNVTIAKDKYLLNYLGATKMYDGSKTYTIIPENEEVTIEKNANEETAITPSRMLTFYKKGYKYKWNIQQNIRATQIGRASCRERV